MGGGGNWERVIQVGDGFFYRFLIVIILKFVSRQFCGL